MAALRPTARMKSLRADLPPLLQTLEGRGIREARARGVVGARSLRRDSPSAWDPPLVPVRHRLRGFRLLHHRARLGAHRRRGAHRRPPSGRVVGDLAGSARQGRQPREARSLRRGGAAPVLDSARLRRGAVRRCGPTDARRWSLPDADPDLPPEVTHIWVVSTWDSGAGMRWAPDAGWSRFAKGVPNGRWIKALTGRRKGDEYRTRRIALDRACQYAGRAYLTEAATKDLDDLQALRLRT